MDAGGTDRQADGGDTVRKWIVRTDVRQARRAVYCQFSRLQILREEAECAQRRFRERQQKIKHNITSETLILSCWPTVV